MRRARRAALLACSLALGYAGGVVSADPPWRPWYEVDAQDWDRMTPGERDSWMLGFLAGSGVADAQRAGAADSLGFVRGIAALRRGLDGARLRYPFAPHVYAGRLGDRFYWENHRREPLWWAMHETNVELLAPMAREGTRHDDHVGLPLPDGRMPAARPDSAGSGRPR